MKRFFCTLIIFVLLPCILLAADVRLAWDPNNPSDQITKYTMYEKIGTAYTKLSDVLPTACTATVCTGTIPNVTPGVHVYVVTASNQWESGYSNEASTPPAPAIPHITSITITIAVP